MPRPTQPVLEPSKTDKALAAQFLSLFQPSGIQYVLVTDKMDFSEGPSYLPNLMAYVFSDIPRSQQMIHRRKDGTGVSVLVPQSNNTNGTFRSAYLAKKRGKGDVMLCCEHGGRAVVRMDLDEVDGKIVVSDRRILVNTFGARMLNSPNDVIETEDGWVVGLNLVSVANPTRF
jgi:sugar lactone lactonase YvrE